jgi:phosphoglucosamine mutase
MRRVGRSLKSGLFGSSGVRGLVNVSLTPVLAARIGLAVATSSKPKKALVAHDTRASGLMIENALVSGLLAGGVRVNCLGVVPTPVLAYLTKTLVADVGVMITASHNPSQYNGIKIFDCGGIAYNEEKQKEIERIVKDERFKVMDWRNVGEALLIDESHYYTEMVQKTVKLYKKWHIIVDPGCGATCYIAPSVFKNLGCKATAINAQPDGFFPGRSPEPNPESLHSLARIVRQSDADVGIAYDGDGDRVAFVDEEGNFVDFDRVLAAYAAHVAKKAHGKTVATNVEASMCVERMVEAEGARVVRTRVGDVYVAEAIEQRKAVFGGEPCGAWIHPQCHYCPDGILSSVLLLKALEEKDKTLSEFISEVPQYPTLRENVACEDDVKHKVVEEAEDGLRSVFPRFDHVSTVDGVRLALEDGWILVRASGTEPVLRLTVEGETPRKAREIMKKGVAVVQELIEEVIK